MAENAEELLNHWWMDVYAWGKYPTSSFSMLESKGLSPRIEEGDLELLKEGKPDFMGVNYCQSTTYEENPLDGVTEGHFNTTGKKGTSEHTGIPGLFKTVKNPNLERNNWDWNIDPAGLRIGLRRINKRYDLPILISKNGLGEYDKLETGHIVNDDYRIDYIRSHLKTVQDAISDGVDMLGYCVYGHLRIY